MSDWTGVWIGLGIAAGLGALAESLEAIAESYIGARFPDRKKEASSWQKIKSFFAGRWSVKKGFDEGKPEPEAEEQ